MLSTFYIWYGIIIRAMIDISKKITAFSFLAALVIFSVTFYPTKAQTASGQSSAITLSVSPQTPQPGENVNLTLSSYSLNLDTSKITWYVDGVAGAENIGQKTFTTQAKNSGESTAIRAVVEGTDGSTNEVDQEINPAGIDLILEPTGYVPPFYKGKPLFVSQGSVRLIAIPNVTENGTLVDSSNLIFQWKENGTILESSSGLGQDSVIINGTVPTEDITMDVSIIDSSGTTVAETSKIISASQPKILFYEDNPLYGELFNKAITTSGYYLGQKEEVDIDAEPYFFTVATNDNSNLNYQWSMNGNSIDTTGGKINQLVLRQTTANLAGTASISLDINDLAQIFQYTSADFSVNFGQ